MTSRYAVSRLQLACRFSQSGFFSRSLYCHTQSQAQSLTFGIFAALSDNNVIGCNGSLPWSLPKDRQLFMDATQDSILIMGRRTFLEEPDFSHISHARRAIVVSTVLQNDSSRTLKADNHSTSTIQTPLDVEVVCSLDQALARAQQLAIKDSCQSDEICWVVGGEPLYRDAIQHPWIRFLYLSHVHTTVEAEKGDIARFPDPSLWEHDFRIVSKVSFTTDSPSTLSFDHSIYERMSQEKRIEVL